MYMYIYYMSNSTADIIHCVLIDKVFTFPATKSSRFIIILFSESSKFVDNIFPDTVEILFKFELLFSLKLSQPQKPGFFRHTFIIILLVKKLIFNRCQSNGHQMLGACSIYKKLMVLKTMYVHYRK